jgi:hypothetical protein
MSDSTQDKLGRYAEVRTETQRMYASIGSIACPALGNERIAFTAHGFNHLVYSGKKERDKRVQIMKFELLEKAKNVLEISTTFQEYEEQYQYMRVNRKGRYVQENILVRCWGFVAIVKKFRVKVVVRQIGNGKKEFYSVIPAWVTKEYRGIKVIENSKGSGLLLEDENVSLKNATSEISPG